MNEMDMRIYNTHLKTTKEASYTKTQEFINRTQQVKTVAVNKFFVKRNRK